MRPPSGLPGCSRGRHRRLRRPHQRTPAPPLHVLSHETSRAIAEGNQVERIAAGNAPALVAIGFKSPLAAGFSFVADWSWRGTMGSSYPAMWSEFWGLLPPAEFKSSSPLPLLDPGRISRGPDSDRIHLGSSALSTLPFDGFQQSLPMPPEQLKERLQMGQPAA